MVEMAWLQAQISKDEWDKINKRRLKLNLKWADVLLPATLEHLDGLEAGRGRAKVKKHG